MLNTQSIQTITEPPKPEGPYPNSILETLDQTFLSELVPVEDESLTKEPRPRFWRRQFGEAITRKQKAFDWTFGLFMPAVCFFFDPIVFRTSLTGGALLERYQFAAYLVSGIAIMAMVTWLLWGDRLSGFGSFFGGLFAVSGFLALLIGIVLLPFSLLGMIFLIGFLGFTPLFTSFVLFRNAVRAYRTASL